jgi:hypothetical protein
MKTSWILGEARMINCKTKKCGVISVRFRLTHTSSQLSSFFETMHDDG